MCFSAEASFIGAGALTIIGAATLKMPLQKHEKLWAMIPLMFAFQQFCEGIVWLDLSKTIPHSPLTVLAKDLYLLFALVVWLMWLPLSYLISEQISWRKNLLKILLILGTTFAIINLNSYSIFALSPSFKKYSIHYLSEAPTYKRLIYLAIVSFPPILSSLKNMKIFGILIIISCLVAEYFYVTTFTSVWCFLAGITSAALFLIARTNVENAQIFNQKKNLIHK